MNQITALPNHWDDLSRLWSALGPPLKPCAVDTTFLNARIREIHADRSHLRALVLGVTPEYYRLDWPPETQLQAADKSAAMIASVWPGPAGSALQSTWSHLSLPDACLDMVVCDGGLNSLPFPAGLQALEATLARTIKPQGMFCVRLFKRPQRQESVQHVLDDLQRRNIQNMNVLKLRLGMAVQKSIESGVEVHELWKLFTGWAGDLEQFAKNQGWPLPHVTAINAYRNSANRYYFYSVEEIIGLFSRQTGHFDCIRVYEPDYDLGDRCPTLVFKRI